MAWLTRLWRNLWHRQDVDRDLDEEVRAALELLIDEKISEGLSPERARRAALIELGQPAAIADQVRDVRVGAFADGALLDVRYAWRLLRRNPLFATVAALSLALGIGANSAMFSLADVFLLRPLPVRDPDAIVTLRSGGPTDRRGVLSYPNYRDLRDRSGSFDGLIAHMRTTVSFAVSRNAAREMRVGVLVSDNFFDVLDVEPLIGRAFTPEEQRVPGRDAVAVLAHAFWKHALGGDPAIAGRVVQINGIDFTVIGVAPEEFTGLDPYFRPAFYVPVVMAGRLNPGRANLLDDRGTRALTVKGRLKPGRSRSAAEAELTAIWSQLARDYPDVNANRPLAVQTELQTRIQGDPITAVVMGMLLALVGLVLAIACANVANLMLGRARGRAREMAVRLALGVSRLRLLRQLLIESALLALIGAAVGLLFAYVCIGFFQTFQGPTDLPIVIAPRLDGRVLMFSLVAATVSALLFGLAPARQSLSIHLVRSLKNADDGRNRRTLGRNILVVAQLALSMILLVAAAMLLDGFRKSLVMSPGFRTDGLIVMSLDTSFAQYSRDRSRAFYRDLVERTRALPGVTGVALTSKVPLDRGGSIEAVVPEDFDVPAGHESVSLFTSVVDEHYFATMRTRIVRGRAFTAADAELSPRVAIVNEEFARVYWPGDDAIGKRLRLGGREGPWLEVVGISETGKHLFIGEAPMPFLYLPFAQNQRAAMSVIVETAGDPAGLAAPLRQAVRALDPNQPVYDVRVFSTFYTQRAVTVPSTILQMVGAMGLIGLALALVGLYAVVAYSVSRRTREIGVRMALGAARRDVLRMILGQGLRLSLLGIAVGGLGTLALAPLLANALAGVGAPNPAVYVLVPVTLVALTLAASYAPARRASLLDPVHTLRHE